MRVESEVQNRSCKREREQIRGNICDLIESQCMIMHNRRGEKSGRVDSGKTRKFIKEGQIIIINSFIKIFMSQNKYLISVWIRMKTFTSNVLTFFLGEVFLFDFVYQCIVHTSKISGGQCISMGPVHYSRDRQTFFSQQFFH